MYWTQEKNETVYLDIKIRPNKYDLRWKLGSNWEDEVN